MMVFHAVCAAVEIVVQTADTVFAMELITDEIVDEIADSAELTVLLIADQTELKKEEIPPQTEEIVEAIAEQAEETVVLMVLHTELKKLEIPPQMEEIVEEIAEQAEETVELIVLHTELKKDVILPHVLWKKDEMEFHTASQLVPNHPQKVSRRPTSRSSAP